MGGRQTLDYICETSTETAIMDIGQFTEKSKVTKVTPLPPPPLHYTSAHMFICLGIPVHIARRAGVTIDTYTHCVQPRQCSALTNDSKAK